ncbi:DNA-processing protein DprA [Paraconexibacter sp.]|uniref:DNA-processing protein DprA n=1 Tax=Paraconexibacter sp. TaxID=2949640 RepID=UPI0035639886
MSAVRSACDTCLRRAWLLGRLAGHLEHAPRARRALRDVLALDDLRLIAALGGGEVPVIHAERAAFDPQVARERTARAGLRAVCRHDRRYPARLHDDTASPAVLFVRDRDEALARLLGGGDLDTCPPAVAIVGARRAGPQALETARALGRSLSAAGVTVVSGLALGVDSAAHEGALAGGGRTVAVLATGADRTYPRTKVPLGERIAVSGAIVSELPPGTPAYRWAFPSRNRIIAALAQLTVVVEAAQRSGSLITADFAVQMGREVAAVPGPAAGPHCRGTNLLLRDGAHLVLEPADVLDGLLGIAGGAGLRPPTPLTPAPAELTADLRRVRDAVAAGRATPAALADGPEDLVSVLAALSELELLGEVRRVPGGAYVATVR